MNPAIDIRKTVLHTERLLLRPWRESDLEDFYSYARVDGVGQMAGWKPHGSLEESGEILQRFIAAGNTFALEYRGRAVGSLGIEEYREERFPEFSEQKCREIGFVLAREYWGQGLMAEAVREAVRYLFEDAGLDAVFCTHYLRNTRSLRVQEKCGFLHYAYGPIETALGTTEDSEFRIMTRERWTWSRMHDAAAAVRRERILSDYVTCGEVSAAVLSRSGRIYTGVCIDTCSTLGICAERNAVFHMIACGEHEIDKVLAILPDGSCGAPCGACRELMVQLMPEHYREIGIMLDYENGKTVTLGELTPHWWI